MSDLNEAISVDVTPTIDWAELGRYFGEHVASPEQAAFFLGFYESVVDMQLAYIGSEAAFASADRADVRQVLIDLAEHIGGGAA